MADSESILQLGIEAARAGDKAEARELFRLVTREDPNNAQGWLWLAGVAEDRDEKRTALEQVVAIDPTNDLARKGLATLTGSRAPRQPAPPAPVAAVPEPPAVAAPSVAAASSSPPAPRRRTGARQYDLPPAGAAGVGAAGAGLAARNTGRDDAVAPVDDDEYDLDDYRVGAAASPDARGTAVIVEDEEPERRGGFGWLPALLGLVALLLVGLFIWQTFRSRPNDVAGTTGDNATALTADPGAGLGGAIPPITATAALGAEGGTAVAALDITAAPVDGAVDPAASPAVDPAAAPPGTEATAAPAVDPAAAPPGTEATAAPAVDPAAAPPGAEATAAPAVDPAAAPPATEQTAAAAPGQTTIVVVPPDATVAPTAAPTTAPTAPPPAAPAPVDVAAANPAVVPNGTVVNAGSWAYTYGGIKNIGTGAYGGAPPTRGQYQITLLAVANNSGAPATIPDGFFVLKDAQGRVYDFNRAASVDYLNRFGGPGVAADVGADANFPNNPLLRSVPLLFDVSPDATNLVLFSRENPNQGFLIR